MKLNNKNIDNLFKTKLQNQKFEVNDAFLSDLEGKLDANFPVKRKKRGVIWFGFIGLVLIFTGIGLYHFASSSTDLVKQITHEKQQIINHKKQLPETTSKASQNKNKTHQESNTIETDVDEYNTNISTSNSNNIKESSYQTTTEKDLTKINHQKPFNHQTTTKQQTTLSSNPANEVRSNSNGNSEDNITTNQKVNSIEIAEKEKELKYDVDVNSTSLSNKNTKANITSNSSTKEEDLSLNNNESTVQIINEIDTSAAHHTELIIDETSKASSIYPTSTDQEENNVETTQNNPIPQDENAGKNSFGLFLNLDAGINFTQPKYSGDNATFFEANHQENKSFDVKFDINTLYKNKFLIGTGLGFSAYENSYNYTLTSTTYDSTTVITDSTFVVDYYIYDTIQQQQIIVDSVYHYDYITGTIMDSTINSTNKQGVTKASYIIIPLNIGYVFSFNRFLFDIEANLRYHILQNATGGFYTNNTFTLFDKSTNPLYKKSYFDMSFKLGVHYNLWKGLYANSSFRFAPRMKSVYSISTLSKTLQTSTLSFGLSYKF